MGDAVAIMQFIQAVENTALATWVRESPTIFAYTSVLTLHAFGLAILVGLNSALALRVLGFGPQFELAPTRELFRWMYGGLWASAISGVLLLMAGASGMLTNWIFYVKMAFIIVGIANVKIFHKLLITSSDIELASHSPSPQLKLRATWSLLIWLGAIIFGRLTAYPGIFG